MANLLPLQLLPEKLLERLLQDKTTEQNIIFATNAYAERGERYLDSEPMTAKKLIFGSELLVRPRVEKGEEEQFARTKKKAEVFTPSWIVNKMNNHCDDEWFGRSSGFNLEQGQTWIPQSEPILFEEERGWKEYVDSTRLEIACGEAPYIVSRYDAATGELIPIENRIGILDRKLRVVNENAADDQEWLQWTKRAFQSSYGYEFQGDNLLIARINLLLTFQEYYQARFQKTPENRLLQFYADLICWNFWQMDGTTGTIPFALPDEEGNQQLLFDFEEDSSEEEELIKTAPFCHLMNWRKDVSFSYQDEMRRNPAMKWDFAIGNPPYQDETLGDNKGFAPPVYDKFLESAYQIADIVEMIHPARFLFNAGSTPKAWNEKMLADSHVKVLFHEQKSSNVFPDTDIKGGVAITYRNAKKEFGAIGVFTPFDEVNRMLKKVTSRKDFVSLESIVVSSYSYHFTEQLHQDYPMIKEKMSQGHFFDLKTNVLEKLTEIFTIDKPDDGNEYIQILGRVDGERTYRYIRRDYVNEVKNLNKYKVFIAKANGSGALGETMSTPLIGAPLIGAPLIGATESFLSVGSFDTMEEAKAAEKYIKSKFARCLLGVLKTTQDITPEKWKYVPLQDFTTSSDIDWSVSIPHIDQQLYKKYHLSQEEIDFIETNVKEME